MTLAYDGTDYHGWQVQPGLKTVQGALETALEPLGLERRTRTAGAGRTDAGVHATGQVASFSAETRLPLRAFVPLLNRHLPADVRVREVLEVEQGFHARHSARARRYSYRLLWREHGLWERFAWNPGRVAAADGLDRAVQVLEGEHDFAAFQASGGPPVRTTCRMIRATWGFWEGGMKLDMIADRFLYHMVRNIVGTALTVAASANPAERMGRVLASRDRRAAGVTAPACALTLEEVFYPAGGGA